MSKKKTYRRHPAETCGQVFPSTPENFSEGSRLSLVTRAQNSSLFHVSQQGTQQAGLCRSRLPHIPEFLAFPRKTSPYLSWCPSPNHEKRPGEHSVARRTQRALPKARTTRPRARRGEVGGTDVAYAFGRNSGYCSSSLRHSGHTS